MTAIKGLARYRKKVEGMRTDLLPTVGQLMFTSIRDGSAITGAPGQPVFEGTLRDSAVLEVSDTRAAVYLTAPQARANEDGVRAGGKPYVQHSSVGGRHSIKLTRAGFQKIVDVAAIMVADKAGNAAGES